MESRTLDAGTMQGLIEYSPSKLVFGRMTFKHRQANGTHFLRLTVTGDRYPTEEEVTAIVNELKGLGIQEPGRHMRIDTETGQRLIVLSWPVGTQARLF